MTNPLSAEAEIIYLDETDSTMLTARRLTAAGTGGGQPASGTVIRAGYQSAGRGRLSDRRWEVRPGDGLMFTVIFTASDLKKRMNGGSFTLLPLLCGLAVAEAVEDYLALPAGSSEAETLPEIKIKWPNDVLAGGCKISGILCEASGKWIYAGIGINLNQSDFPESLRRPATSLRMLLGRPVDAGNLLGNVLGKLNNVLAYGDWRERIEKRLFGMAIPAVIAYAPEEPEASGGETTEGIIRGINAEGAILIESSGKLLPFVSGELRV